MRKLKYGILLGTFVAMFGMTTMSYAGNEPNNTSDTATVSDAGSMGNSDTPEVSTMDELPRFVSSESELRDAAAFGGTIELTADILLTESLDLENAKLLGHNHKLYTHPNSGIKDLITGGELKDLTIETMHEKCAINNATKVENVKLISKVETDNTGISFYRYGGSEALNITLEGYKTGIDCNTSTSITNATITRGEYSKKDSKGIDCISVFASGTFNNVNISGYDVAVYGSGRYRVVGGIFNNNNIALEKAASVNGSEVKNNKIGIRGARRFTNVNVSDNEIGILVNSYSDTHNTGNITNNEIGIMIINGNYPIYSETYDNLNISSNKRYEIYSEKDTPIDNDNFIQYTLEWKEFSKDGVGQYKKAYCMVDKGREFTITEKSDKFSKLTAVKVDNVDLDKEKIQTTKDNDTYIHKITLPAHENKRVELKYEFAKLSKFLVYDAKELEDAILSSKGETIYLKSDIELNSTLFIGKGNSLIHIDGEGHKIYTNNKKLKTLIQLALGSNVKLSNVNIIDTRDSIEVPETAGIFSEGSLEIENTNIKNFTKAILSPVNVGSYNKISGEVSDGTNIKYINNNSTNDTNNSGGGSGGGSRGGSGGGSRGGSGGGSVVAKTSENQTQLSLTNISSNLPSINAGNWEKTNQKWSLKKSDGQYAKNQWANIASKWYFLNTDGYMLTGLHNINNTTYNFANDGSMSLGWVNINNKWYYFNTTSGAMIKGWILYNNNWYYLNQNGTMATSWIKTNDKWYYLSSNGSMLANTTTPDGYHVNANGEWIK